MNCIDVLIPLTPTTHEHPRGITPVHTACSEGHKDVVEVLAGAGWSLNARDSDGFIPLHSAAEEGRLEVISYLLENGVDPLSRNNEGKTVVVVVVVDSFGNSKG